MAERIALGCWVNGSTFREDLDFFLRAGFLYQEKRDRLGSHLEEIEANWQSLLASRGEIGWSVVLRDPQGLIVGCESNWRATGRSWTAQHLVARHGNAMNVLFAAADHYCCAYPDENYDLWFRPDNRMPQDLFSGFIEAGGPMGCEREEYRYYVQTIRSNSVESLRSVPVEDIRELDDRMLATLAESKGPVALQCEEFEQDPLLEECDRIFSRYGLTRRRRMIGVPFGSELIGVGIDYEGPVGLNFSFLENRLEIHLVGGLNRALSTSVVESILRRASELRAVRGLSFMPVVASAAAARAMEAAGYEEARRYSRVFVSSGAKERVRDYLLEMRAKVANRGARRRFHNRESSQREL